MVHVIAPELGLTQPGMTVACGDSHTSTHGAFGAIAFGIGTSQVRDVLASQSLAMNKLKVRRIQVEGELQSGVYRQGSDPPHHPRPGGEGRRGLRLRIRRSGDRGPLHGGAHDPLQHGDRGRRPLRLCQSRCHHLCLPARGGPMPPPARPGTGPWPGGTAWPAARRPSIDDDRSFRRHHHRAHRHLGHHPRPGHRHRRNRPHPRADREPTNGRSPQRPTATWISPPASRSRACRWTSCFIGSCTNGRLSDLRAAAAIARGRHVAPGIKAFVVPGSEQVAAAAEAEGLDAVFREAGFEWREPGCSMCLAMNPDRLEGRQISASSSNRNFKGRQGSARGRTLLMSPAMVAAAAVNGPGPMCARCRAEPVPATD